MTALEKVKKEYPGDFDFSNFPINCPSTYGYLEDPSYCKDPIYGSFSKRCSDCWNREIPGSDIEDGVTEEMKQQIIEESSTIVHRCAPGKPDLELKVEQKTMLGTEDMYINAKTLPVAKILDSGNRRQFESGAVRDIQEGKGRCDLLPLDVVAEYMENAIIGHIANFQQDGDTNELHEALSAFVAYSKVDWDDCTMILEVSKHFEEGAKKYGENNWQKGIPVHCYIDSAVRHYLKFLRGDKDEPHDRAFCWNILCAIWTCKHKPELNEYGRVEEEK